MREPRTVKDAFLKVLGKVPVQDRAQIYAFWARVEATEPHLEEATLARMHEVGASPSAAAATRGASFYFRYELLDDAPDDVLEAIIAHELAHSYNGIEQGVANAVENVECKLDKLYSTAPEVIEQRKREMKEHIEREADRVAGERWHFDVKKARKWCADNLGGTID